MALSGHKYVFVLGGVMSGVGKGIAASSMALILKQRGYEAVSYTHLTLPTNREV